MDFFLKWKDKGAGLEKSTYMRLGKEYIGNESSHACAEWQLTSVCFVIILS